MRFITALLALVALTSTADEGFEFSVMDVFKVSGGVVDIVITGKVERGNVSVGDAICLRSSGGGGRELTVGAIETFGKSPGSVKAGDMAGIGVSGIDREEISKGDMLSATCDG